jgi:hypothetical protein
MDKYTNSVRTEDAWTAAATREETLTQYALKQPSANPSSMSSTRKSLEKKPLAVMELVQEKILRPAGELG